MPTKKKRELVPVEVPKTKARRRKPVAEPVTALAESKRLMQSNWAEPKWIQRGTELEKLERTFAAAAKANELYKNLQTAFGLMPTNLPNSLSFPAPTWVNFAGAQRVFKRLEQFERLAKSFKLPTESELEARYEERKKAVLILAKRGWFIPLRMNLGELKTLFKKMAAGQEAEVEALIEKHLEAKLAEIEAELAKQVPDLGAMLKEAFELHDEGRYFGSVALFLSLSEGIGQRIFQASPVSSSKENLKRIRKLIEPHRNKDFLMGWFWDAIGEVLPVNDKTDNLEGYVEPLNRHAVLHVLRSDHGTKRHSLKAVSWLDHVSQFRNLLAARAATASTDAT
jgi:hypothetical protein